MSVEKLNLLCISLTNPCFKVKGYSSNFQLHIDLVLNVKPVIIEYN